MARPSLAAMRGRLPLIAASAFVVLSLLLTMAPVGTAARSIAQASAPIDSVLASIERDVSSNAAAGDPVSSFSTLSRDKWIGLGLAISSSLAIGTSFIITKKGLMDAAEQGGGASDGHAYLGNPIWWAGMSTMIVGEVANFAAYTFAPPILVTPLGALSVLIGAVLASFILKEELGRLGRVGCTLCLVGTVIIIMNAPEDKEIKTVDEILNYAIQMPFLTYCLFVTGFAIYMIWRVVPRYGKRTPLVYISICSLVGSISVMSVKGFGVALKLTLDGNNQFTHPSTYCFAIVVVVCILVQMNYFNKALDQFSTNIVNPIYYVMFTTSTIFASFLLFRGFNTEGPGAAVSLLGGFVVIFMGVYLLNLNRLVDPVTQQPRVSFMTGEGLAGTGRLSEHHERLLGHDGGFHHRRGGSMSGYHPSRRDSTTSSLLFGGYEDEEAMGLSQLNETSEDVEADNSAFGNGHKAKAVAAAAAAERKRRSSGGSARTHTRSASDGYTHNGLRSSAVVNSALDNDALPDSANHTHPHRR